MSTDPLRPTSIADLHELVGRELGPTAWLPVDQAWVTAFADITRDRQWIHVDPERAQQSAFGGTIAHGLLTLAMGPWFLEELMSFAGFANTLNYGYEKIRFPAPTPVGSRIRMRATVDEVRPTADGSALLVTTQTFECDASAKPVCVAVSLGRFTEQTPGEAANPRSAD